MRRSRLAIFAGAFLLVGPVRAGDLIGEAKARRGAQRVEQRSSVSIHAAPGGGQMLIAGPELHYTTRGRVESDGRLTTQCEQAGAPSPAVRRGR